jgi:hypothetical protein
VKKVKPKTKVCSKSGGVKEGDVSALLPPGYKERDSTTEKSEKVAKGAKQDRTSALLPSPSDDHSKTSDQQEPTVAKDKTSFLTASRQAIS